MIFCLLITHIEVIEVIEVLEVLEVVEVVEVVVFCQLTTLITCLKGGKSLGMLYGSGLQQWLSVSYLISQSVTREPIELSGDS